MDKISTENIDLKIKLLEDFNNLEVNLNGESKNNIHKIRQDAIASFEELGFPVKKMEAWKYTNLKFRFIILSVQKTVKNFTFGLKNSENSRWKNPFGKDLEADL